MTSTRGWSLDEIHDEGDNFHLVERVSATAPDLLQKIKKYEANGVPLVIEGFHKHPKWPQRMFTIDQFVDTHDGHGTRSMNDVFRAVEHANLYISRYQSTQHPQSS